MASARYARDKIVSYLAQRELWEMWHGSWPPVADGHSFVFPICFFPRIVHRDSGIFFRIVLEMSYLRNCYVDVRAFNNDFVRTVYQRPFLRLSHCFSRDFS